MRLEQQVNVVSQLLACRKTAWTRQAVSDRPQQEEAWALRGDTLGLAVVARRGECREQWSLRKMPEQLQTGSPLSICRHEVP